MFRDRKRLSVPGPPSVCVHAQDFPGSSAVKKSKVLSSVRLFATPRTIAHQAPLSMEFFRQEYWSGLLCPSPGDCPNPGIKPRSPTLQADSLPSEPSGTLFPSYSPAPSPDALVFPVPKGQQCLLSCSKQINLWFPRGDKQGLVPFPPP